MNQNYTFKLAYPFNAEIEINELIQETVDDSEFFGEGLFEEATEIEALQLDLSA